MKYVFIALFVLMFVALPGGASARVPQIKPTATQRIPILKPIVATYDVYVGGLHFLTADILFQEENGKYHARVKAKTYGFFYKLFPWDNMLDASGVIDDDHFVPALYVTHDVFRKKPKDSKLDFDAAGNITASFEPPSHDEDREQVTADQKRGALDPVTALLQMLAHTAMDKSCNVTVPVFDGKRRFDITGSDDNADAYVDDKEYGAYHGPARLCDATFNMIAGAFKKGEHTGFWQKNDKEAGREPFHIWLATISPDLPDMAVRLESGSVWGFIIAHLSQWRYAGPDDLKP